MASKFMRIVPLLAIIVILARVIYSFSIIGQTDPKYINQCFYSLDSILFIIIGLFLSLFIKKQKDYCRVIIQFGRMFCFSLPCLLLAYAFLPDPISVHLVSIIYGYFLIWGLTSICLIVYYIFCVKGDLL